MAEALKHGKQHDADRRQGEGHRLLKAGDHHAANAPFDDRASGGGRRNGLHGVNEAVHHAHVSHVLGRQHNAQELTLGTGEPSTNLGRHGFHGHQAHMQRPSQPFELLDQVGDHALLPYQQLRGRTTRQIPQHGFEISKAAAVRTGLNGLQQTAHPGLQFALRRGIELPQRRQGGWPTSIADPQARRACLTDPQARSPQG